MQSTKPHTVEAAPGKAAAGAEEIYGELHNAILEQRLAPGTKLPEDGLGDIFGVSRTIVRKALLRLAHENLIEVRPNRGAIVASPTIEEAAEVFEARRVVEGALIDRLIPVVGEAQIEQLNALVGKERAAHRANNRAELIRLSGAFHLRLAESAGNSVLAEYLMELVSRTSLIISLYERPGNSACSHEEHAGIIEALAAKDAPRARALMDAHLQACEEKLNIDAPDTERGLAEIFARPALAAGQAGR